MFDLRLSDLVLCDRTNFMEVVMREVHHVSDEFVPIIEATLTDAVSDLCPMTSVLTAALLFFPSLSLSLLYEIASDVIWIQLQ
jgi:hypothetical protein